MFYKILIGFIATYRRLFLGMVDVADNQFWRLGLVRIRPSSVYSLRRAAKLFDSLGGKVIVEIGSGVQGRMMGDSVVIWEAKTGAEKIHAVDLDEHQIDTVKARFPGASRVLPVVEDGVEFCRNLEDQIDLLYLDYWVPDVEGDIEGSARSRSYQECYRAAKSKLAPQALILIDDTDHMDPWKQTGIIEAARIDGFNVCWTGRQTMLFRNGD